MGDVSTYSHQESGYPDPELFAPLYQMTASKVIGILVSAFNIFCCTPVLYFVIWYPFFLLTYCKDLEQAEGLTVGPGCEVLNLLASSFEKTRAYVW